LAKALLAERLEGWIVRDRDAAEHRTGHWRCRGHECRRWVFILNSSNPVQQAGHGFLILAYAWFAIEDERRKILHFDVTNQPTAVWSAHKHLPVCESLVKPSAQTHFPSALQWPCSALSEGSLLHVWSWPAVQAVDEHFPP
jgi:hypothetical protein